MAISRSQPLIVNETPSIAPMFHGHVQFDTAPALVHLRALAEEPLSGVRALLAHAVEAKVGALLASHADKLTEDGRHRLVRQQLGRPRIAQDLEAKILAALMAPGRTEGVRKIAKRFGVDPGTVQRISRPFDSAGAAA